MTEKNKQPSGDIGKIFGTAVSGVAEMVGDVKSQVNERIENYLASMDLVKKEEFEVLKEMVSESRIQQEEIIKRLDALEKKK